MVELFTENEAIARKNTTFSNTRSPVKQIVKDSRMRSPSFDRPNRRDCLYLQGLVGSVTEERIRNELLEDFGEITGFWTSRLKKHCFIYVNSLNILKL